MAVSNICSLCFASADSSEDVEFVQIDKFASFLRDLAECEITNSKDVSMSICSTCEYQIEASLLLRNRVQFTQKVWRMCRDRIDTSDLNERKPIICNNDLLLGCHLCGHCGDLGALQLHMATSHGHDHVSSCDLCSVLCRSFVVASCGFQLNTQEPADSKPDDSIISRDENDADVEPEEFLVAEVPEYFLGRNGKMTKLHKCRHCERYFHRPIKLRAHMLRDHPSSGSVAQVVTVTEGEWGNRDDLDIGRESSKARFKCNDCDKSFQRQGMLRIHTLKRHRNPGLIYKKVKDIEYSISKSGRRTRMHQCQYCDRMFHRPVKLNAHIQRHHPDVTSGDSEEATADQDIEDSKTIDLTSGVPRKMHKCSYCERIFNRPVRLNAHILKSHPRCINGDVIDQPGKSIDELLSTKSARQAKQHTCQYCMRIFTRPVRLNAHMLKCHPHVTGDDQVDESGDSSSEVAQNDNAADAPFFITKNGTRVKLHKCQYCHRSFHRPVKLRAHILRTHSSERETAKHTLICERCGKSFTTLDGLRGHVRRAHGEDEDERSLLLRISQPCLENGRKVRWYSCPQCGLKCARTNQLRRHMASVHNRTLPHRVVRNYDKWSAGSGELNGWKNKCSQCGKYFAQRSSLLRHLRNVHKLSGYKAVIKDPLL